MIARLYKCYVDTVVPGMMRSFSYKNSMQVPRVEKVVLSMGIGRIMKSGKAGIMDSVHNALSSIACQSAVFTLAHKSIAGFSIRKGMVVGSKVTLRGHKMYEFIDRLIMIALPMVRDFRGLSPKSFSCNHALNIGIKEHHVFPEIDYDNVSEFFGLNISVVTNSNTVAEARALLSMLGFPFYGQKTLCYKGE